MAGMTWDGGRAVIATCPMAVPGPRLTLSSTAIDGSCPLLNVSCCAPPAARCQPTIAGTAPSDGGSPPYGFGGPVGTVGDDPVPCHAARQAPWQNGLPNGPLAVSATARDSMLRRAVGADVGFAGSYGGRV